MMTEAHGLISQIRRLAASAIAAMIALALTVAFMTYGAWQSSQWVVHTRQVQFAGAKALHLALDRQVSIDAYLITGDTASLALEHSARPALQRELQSLEHLTRDNAAQQAALQRIVEAIGSWDSAFANRAGAVSDAATRAAVGRDYASGTAAFATVRARIDDFLEQESALYAQRAQRSSLWRWGEVIVIAIEAIIVLFALSGMRRRLIVQASQAIEHQLQLEEQAVELEAQAAEQEMLTTDVQEANQQLMDAAVEQEALTADLEIANQELTEAAVEAEEARDNALMHEERYRLLFDRNPVPLWVYDEETLRFLAVNEAAVQHYGYSAEEFLSMTLADIRPLEDVARLRRHSKHASSSLHGTDGWRHRLRDGRLISVDIVAHSVEFEGRPARIVLSMDVTARALAEERLSQNNGILRAVVDDSPLAIILYTPDFTITRWNNAAAEQFGWSAEEAIGASLFTIIPEERRDEFMALRKRLEAGEIVTNVETQRRRRDGSLRDMAVSQCALHASDGTLTGFVSIFSDETERKRLEAQFRQAQKMEAVGQLAGGVAHDFNNLLTVIISYSQMLLGDLAEGSTPRADVNEIKRAAERAALLTKQLLAFSRQQVLRPHILDLNIVVRDLEQMLRRLLREDIDIVLTLDPALGTVAADPGQVEQIVMNLVVNARDAMPDGGRLAIETANVEFESPYQLRASEMPLEAGSYVMIAVSDNGSGMSPEVQARVFEPFFTTKRVHEGTGLGLSTVYGIVKQSGGHLAMYSEEGQGTIFKIYFPRVDSPADIASTEADASTPQAHGGECVLIVEDDDALRTVARRALEQCGYSVLVASNGQSALRQCAEYEGTLDLVITDMVMPEMSGVELVERMAVHFPKMRVLLMSGYTRDETARRGIASERIAFLEKPFTPAKLAAKVRELLDGARTRVQGMQTA